MKLPYNAIVAMDQHGRIGKDGKLPWASPEDLKLFASRTKYSTILMGRKTFESLPNVLPHRHHVVLSKQDHPPQENVTFVKTRFDAIDSCTLQNKPVWVIGGASVYKQFLSMCESIVITHFNIISVPSPGDVYMPDFWRTMFPYIEKEANEYDLDIFRYWKGPTVEDKVIAQIKERQAAGLAKYGTSMRRTDLSIHDWLQHAKEEMLDGANIFRYWKGPTVEDKVIAQIKERQAAGLAKYGTSMRRTDLSIHDWLQHAKEEMLDGAIYLQKLQDQLEHDK